MATPIRLKRSSEPAKRPQLSDLQLGELAVNTYDGALYTKRERVGVGTEIVQIGFAGFSDFPTVTNIIYVTADGSDGNSGRKLGEAKATIKGAIAIAGPGSVIKVSAGTYVEDNPIEIPDQVSIVGDSLREVTVTPQNQADLFYVGNGNYIWNMSFVGVANTGSAIVSFNPNKQVYNNQSPYIQNCTNFIPGSIGMKIDGSLSLGPTKSMVVDSYTQYNQGGIGVSITNEGYAQLVSLFTICPDIAVYCGSGGACDLTNSNASFGNYGLVADGVGEKKYAGVITSAASENSDTFVLNLSTPTKVISNITYDNTTGITTVVTTSPHRFNVGMGISIKNAAFICASQEIPSIPDNDVINAFYDNTTGVVEIITDNSHSLSVGMAVRITGLQFTCSSGPGIVTYPSGNLGYTFRVDEVTSDTSFLLNVGISTLEHVYNSGGTVSFVGYSYPSGNYGYNFDIKTVAPGRYVDAGNLIDANRTEIQDKSLAAIAIDYPDFYFPGDSQTNSRSRYYDSYRLIQKNKNVIVETAFNQSLVAYPGISTSETKCKRDLGYFVDAVSTDVFTGGNSYIIAFTKFYFDGAGNPISNGLVGEETQSVYAFNSARDLMKNAITNTLVGAAYTDTTITPDPTVGSNQSPNSCADVQTNIDNLTSIATQTITAGNLDLINSITLNYGAFTDGGSKCRRDIGYIIDAISEDVRTYTNENSINAVKAYFDYNGNPINNGLLGEEGPSVVGFTSVGYYAKKAITNQLNIRDLTIVADPVTGFNTSPASCANVQTFIDNLVSIITTPISAGNLNSLPSVSMASTVFTINTGISTLSHEYVTGGIVNTNINRPYDGQVVYFGDLFYSVNKVLVSAGGTGYTSTPTVTIDAPVTSWGIQASAIPEVTNGTVTAIQILSSGRGYTSIPRVTISAPNVGINTAKATIELLPSYYSVLSSTPISSGICTITVNDNVPYAVGLNTTVKFFKQSRILASGHSFEYIGSGTQIGSALPVQGGVAIQDNETDARNGGLVVYTSTDQSGNFRIGEGVSINQQTGTISGAAYSKSLFSTLTPFILALGGE
jgi:hypothetical protein